MDTQHSLRPDGFVDSRDFDRVARAIAYIDEHFREQPRLATIAAAVRLSEFHFNRLFRRWAGITPRQYLAFVTAHAAHRKLGEPGSVLEAAYSVGLSGPGRLHDLLVTLDAVTPGEVKQGGSGVRMSYGFAETPFGTALLGSTARGISHLAFLEPGGTVSALDDLRGRWPNAQVERDDDTAAALSRRIWSAASGTREGQMLQLLVRGTNFQVKVWRALLELGSRGPTTYEALARAVGAPGAAQAVGNAVGANPVAWLIPCHNVLRKDGKLGGYRWGAERKRAMLSWSALRTVRSGEVSSAASAAGLGAT
ncbi:MAG TPA: methylated-DNA--[protein]-cysteine S-methyltransferase [Steroidobacteraceae bacterium]|nr:methylated-DNA--[protein]-cysteine S-methyltransferase [Steroidobacteraceae bacterium]